MRFSLTSLEPLDGEDVLPLADAKKHLRVEADAHDDDPLIEALTVAAIDWVERYTGVALMRRQFRWEASGLYGAIALPIGPVVSVDTVEYLDGAGVTRSLAATGWRMGGRRVQPAQGMSWPATLDEAGAASIVFTAGHEDAAGEVPALVAAVRLLLGDFFAQRESLVMGAANEVPYGVRALCDAHRIPVL